MLCWQHHSGPGFAKRHHRQSTPNSQSPRPHSRNQTFHRATALSRHMTNRSRTDNHAAADLLWQTI